MLQPPFSVLMSLYAKERPENLDACLRSLQQQTCQPDDIVMVIDGPIGADLASVIVRWQDKLNLHQVQLSSNVGLGRALAAGMQQCRHRYIARMDTDDVCLPQRFARQIEYLQAHPDVVLLGSAVIEFDEHGEQRLKRLPESHAEIKLFSRLKNPFNHMSVIFDRDIVAQVGGYRHHLYMEDYNLWLRILAANFRTHNLPDVLLHVRAGASLLKKRRGWNYLKSEVELYNLKRRLGSLTPLKNVLTFVLRACSRVAPEKVLGLLYRTDRARL